MEHEKIHFENEPFMAVVKGKGVEPILCTPVIYEEPSRFGIGILYLNGEGKIWGLIYPRSMIVAWRATEVLRHLKRIEDDTLFYAYYTGIRNPSQNDLKNRVEPMISKIGRDSYNKIMSKKVPEKIIRATLDGQKRSGFDFDISSIADEITAGTIEWRQEFVDAGIVLNERVKPETSNRGNLLSRFLKI